MMKRLHRSAQSPALIISILAACWLTYSSTCAADPPEAEPAKFTAIEPGPAEAPRALEFIERDAPHIAAFAVTAAERVEAAKATLAAAETEFAKARSLPKPAEVEIEKAQAAVKSAKDALANAEKQAAAAKARAEETPALIARYKQAIPVADPKNIRLIDTFPSELPLHCCRIDPQGQSVFVGGQARSLARWDLVTGERTTFGGLGSWIRRFDLSADGTKVWTAAFDGKLQQWDTLSDASQPSRTIDAHTGFARTVVISPDGKWLVSAGNDGHVKIWSATKGDLVKTLTDHAGPLAEPKGHPDWAHRNHVNHVAFHPNGRSFVSGDLRGVVKQWEVGTWKHVRDYDAATLYRYDKKANVHGGGIECIEFSPDGKLLAVGGIADLTNTQQAEGTATVLLFDTITGAHIVLSTKGTKLARGRCWGVRFHPSGKLLVAATAHLSGGLTFWRTGETEILHQELIKGAPHDVAWHPDGVRLAVALYDKAVQIYDVGPKPEAAEGDSNS